MQWHHSVVPATQEVRGTGGLWLDRGAGTWTVGSGRATLGDELWWPSGGKVAEVRTSSTYSRSRRAVSTKSGGWQVPRQGWGWIMQGPVSYRILCLTLILIVTEIHWLIFPKRRRTDCSFQNSVVCLRLMTRWWWWGAGIGSGWNRSGWLLLPKKDWDGNSGI